MSKKKSGKSLPQTPIAKPAISVPPSPMDATEKSITSSPSTSTSKLRDNLKLPVTPTKSEVKGSPASGNGVIGYVHNLSPSMRNKSDTNNYSTFVLQTSSGEHQPALLYSKNKRQLLVDSEKSRSPIKIQKFTSTADKTKLIINDATNISVPRPDECSFQFEEQTRESQAPTTTIEQIKTDFTEFKRITVVGKVVQKGKTFLAGGKWKLCTATIADDKDQSISLDLWEEFISQVEEGGTYSLSPVQMRSFRGNKKISTVVTTVIKEIQDVDMFPDLTVDPSCIEIMSSITKKVAKIGDVEKLERYKKCHRCLKKILQAASSFSVQCDYCGRYMRSEECIDDICAKFSILDGDETVFLTAFGSSLEIVVGDVRVSDLSDTEIVDKLLRLANFEVTYDYESKIVECIVV